MNKRMERIAKLMITQLREEETNRLKDIKVNDLRSFAEEVKTFETATGEKASIKKMVEANVDMILNSGDALEAFIDDIREAIEEVWNNE